MGKSGNRVQSLDLEPEVFGKYFGMYLEYFGRFFNAKVRENMGENKKLNNKCKTCQNLSKAVENLLRSKFNTRYFNTR